MDLTAEIRTRLGNRLHNERPGDEPPDGGMARGEREHAILRIVVLAVVVAWVLLRGAADRGPAASQDDVLLLRGLVLPLYVSALLTRLVAKHAETERRLRECLERGQANPG